MNMRNNWYTSVSYTHLDVYKRQEKRELANARLKKHRKRKREEAQQQNLVSQNEPNEQSNEQIQQNKLK